MVWLEMLWKSIFIFIVLFIIYFHCMHLLIVFYLKLSYLLVLINLSI